MPLLETSKRLERNGAMTLAVADIQELGQVGSYMLDIMDIIISEKEFFNNIVFL